MYTDIQPTNRIIKKQFTFILCSNNYLDRYLFETRTQVELKKKEKIGLCKIDF